MAKQKSEYVQKIRDIESRHAEESAMTGAVEADDVQDAAEFEAQCDMLELSLADKNDKLNAANASIEALKGDIRTRDQENEALRSEMAAHVLQLAEQQAKADEAARELEANTIGQHVHAAFDQYPGVFLPMESLISGVLNKLEPTPSNFGILKEKVEAFIHDNSDRQEKKDRKSGEVTQLAEPPAQQVVPLCCHSK
jgi:hypothetical protein